MFKRYPYWGWLFLSLILWGLTVLRYHQGKEVLKPANMAAVVQQEIQADERSFDELLKNETLVKQLFSDRHDGKAIEQITSLPYYIYTYVNDTLLFWNNNKILVDCSSASDSTSLVHNERGYFLQKCVAPALAGANKKIVALFPILIQYPFENNYIRSHFQASSNVPASTKISKARTINSYAVKGVDGNVAFYLQFSEVDIPDYIPDSAILWLIAFALLASISWMQLVTIVLTRKRTFWLGFGITLLFVIGIRALIYIYGLPFSLDNLQLFSPQLYASSGFLRSLGDVLLNALCLLWIVVFLVRHIAAEDLATIKTNSTVRTALAILVCIVMLVYSFGFINVISSLVIDSNISFDVSHFYYINTYTIVGLFTIGLLTCASCLSIYLFNLFLSVGIKNRWLKYALIILVGAIVILVSKKTITGHFSYFLLLWLIVFIFFLDIKNLTKINDLLAPQVIFWAFFVCAFCTAILQRFNHIKEEGTRKRFAEQILEQRDNLTEYSFRSVSQDIQRDAMIKAFFRDPTAAQRRIINERFDALYLGGQLNKYQSKVLFYDAAHKGLFNTDTIGYWTLVKQLDRAEPVNDSTLYYKEYAQDGHYYLAYIPIHNDSSGKTTGYVLIDFNVKDATGENVYPELLQPLSLKSTRNEADYNYGIYINGHVITQKGISFPGYLSDTTGDHFSFKDVDGTSQLKYLAGNNKIVLVTHENTTLMESITLFSYLFGIQMVIVILIVFYRTYLFYFTKQQSSAKFLNLTLRRRIHFSMLGIVLLSFVIIGVVTTVFFANQNSATGDRKLQSVMQIVNRSIVQFLKSENALDNPAEFNKATATPGFKNFVSSLANAQKVDLNIYNASGTLNFTSQENVYDKYLLARIMNPDAYYRLSGKDESFMIQNESIGRLSYLSCYMPIREANGYTLGYINVPSFSSAKELNFQISNILVALINLYAFIFLISSAVAVFMTRWLTGTLSVVINRFEKLNLSENELIDWPHEDEIGMLVREYNKMVKKVESSAVLLAQSEREGAWREMARQVAHEIKNPLTPMKLNIQYLQQALRTNHENVKELAAKVADSLIEQIDNLSYIATEFSSFAKMPEARPEKLDLNELLGNAVKLHQNEEHSKVTLSETTDKLLVYADKSQMLRVFNNVIENAVQAIEGIQQGYVKVSATKENETALIIFEDNGSGIAKETIEKIFQPYFTTKSSGTGLGLAMTKKIIEFWKGEIWFETEEGTGTTFYMRLPLI